MSQCMMVYDDLIAAHDSIHTGNAVLLVFVKSFMLIDYRTVHIATMSTAFCRF